MLHTLQRNIELDFSKGCQGYFAGLFRDHDRNAIRLLADSERGAVARAELRDEQRIGG